MTVAFVRTSRASDSLPTDSTRPNILWVYLEDTNDWMSCYGDEVIETPNIDALADRDMLLPRHKQFLYEGGIRVPLIIAGPGVPQGEVRDDLVNAIDLGPTALAMAGITIPPHMEGQNLFADDYQRDYVVSARDRCDYTIDRIRAVTGKHFKYLRNFMTDRPYLQPQ